MRSRIAGTEIIRVGFSTETSPFVPFLILLDASVIVRAEPYPIATPEANMTVWINNTTTMSVNIFIVLITDVSEIQNIVPLPLVQKHEPVEGMPDKHLLCPDLE
jgi:hypothetical protein